MEQIKLMTTGTYYDYMIIGENNKKLAYKEKDKEWIINDSVKALEQCFHSIEQQQAEIDRLKKENEELKDKLRNNVSFF